MIIEDLLAKRNMTKYRLAVAAEVPHATLNDICSGKTRLEKCSAETVYKLAKALDVSMEMLTEGGIRETKRERSFEYGLPDYLQHDLDAYKEGLKAEYAGCNAAVKRIYGRLDLEKIWQKGGTAIPKYTEHR
nr:helix-turn-helix domain-containing protein [uncultured Schaedlerella sp.]